MKPEIAIALSGGGYRAAMFHLGTLSYLHHLHIDEEHTFLDMVNTISTISGGTLTGLWYMLQYSQDAICDDSFRDLYFKLINSKVAEKGFKNLLEKSGDSLIKEMIQVYDEEFFNHANFGIILNKIDHGHIHHFSANGTDFSNGLAFRFQASRKILNQPSPFDRGFIGNKEHIIPWNVAKRIKLSEIFAISSCFPGGFEPIFFPSDLEIGKENGIHAALDTISEDIPLMDGGIVDNQGIEPILLANSQMQLDDERANGKKDFPCHDLIIVSDVAYPKVKPFEKKKACFNSNFSLGHVDNLLDITLVLSLIISIIFFCVGCTFISGFFWGIALIVLLLCIGSRNLKRYLKRVISVFPIAVDFRKLWSLPFSSIIILAVNRGQSFLQLSKAIFMKPIRQMRYNSLYATPMWKNRRITNTIYELTADFGSWKNKLKKNKIPSWLAPSEEMQKTSKLATEMGTTLWFSDEDKINGTPEALLACGQYNICMNLLEYIEKLKMNAENTSKAHNVIMALEDHLKQDWEQFKLNPQWMVENFKCHKE